MRQYFCHTRCAWLHAINAIISSSATACPAAAMCRLPTPPLCAIVRGNCMAIHDWLASRITCGAACCACCVCIASPPSPGPARQGGGLHVAHCTRPRPPIGWYWYGTHHTPLSFHINRAQRPDTAATRSGLAGCLSYHALGHHCYSATSGTSLKPVT